MPASAYRRDVDADPLVLAAGHHRDFEHVGFRTMQEVFDAAID
jgi:hypothetical protein